MAEVSIRVEGFEQLVASLRDKGLLGEPMRRGLTGAAFFIESEAKKRAPVDRGLLRAGITNEVDTAPIPQWARIGTEVAYGPFMEFGTGRNSDGPSPKSSHSPPGAALAGWGARHGGASGFAIAAAIRKRGGLKPRRFLRGAIEGNNDRIVAIIAGAFRNMGR